MSTVPRSLACELVRPVVHDLLNIGSASFPLPRLTRCPLCASPTLSLFWDSLFDAEWGHCSHCRFSGDLLEFLARKRGRGLGEACDALVRIGGLAAHHLERVDQFITQHVTRREAFRAFWREASDRLANGRFDNLDAPLWRILGLTSRDLLDKGRMLSQWIGVADREQLEDLWHPESYCDVEQVTARGEVKVRRRTGPGESRLFRGSKWAEVLIVPAYDLPGRICGMLIIGRDALPEHGDVFYRAAPWVRKDKGQVESGLLMRDQLDCTVKVRRAPRQRKSSTVMWSGARFVCTDPLFALELQSKSVADHTNSSLPLISYWRDDRHGPVRSWEHVTAESLIFFDGEDPDRAIREALPLSAQVGMMPAPEERILLGQSILSQIYATRVPVLRALANRLEEVSTVTAASLLESMPLTDEQRRRLADELPDHLQYLLKLGHSSRTFLVGTQRIIESPEGWFNAKTKERLVNALPRVSEIVGGASPSSTAVGRVRIGDEEHGFELPLAAIEQKGFFHVLRENLRARQIGELLFDKQWARHAWDAVVARSRPVMTSPCNRVGWDATRREFCFPNFRIGKTVASAPPMTVSDKPSPCVAWRADVPSELVRESLQQLSESERAVFWALTVVVAENLLAPHLDSDRIGLVVAGQAAQEYVSGLGPMMGLLMPKYPTKMSAGDQAEWIESRTTEHDVPPILDLRGDRGQAGVRRWLSQIGQRPGILLLQEHTVASVGTQQRFHVLRLPESRRPRRRWSPPSLLPADLLVPWLHELRLRGFKFSNRRQVLLLQVEEELRDWLRGRCEKEGIGNIGNMGNVLLPSTLTNPLEALNAILRSAAFEDVVLTRECESTTRKLDRVKLNRRLQQLNCPELDWAAVAEYLASKGVHVDLEADEWAWSDIEPLPRSTAG